MLSGSMILKERGKGNVSNWKSGSILQHILESDMSKVG
jgi:hypothetical protein